MVKLKKITEVIGRKVYTDTGDYFGEIEESNLIENKVDGWKIKITGPVGNFLGGAKGVIIPHQFVKAIGDVMIISRASLPLDSQESGETEETINLSESDDSDEGLGM